MWMCKKHSIKSLTNDHRLCGDLHSMDRQQLPTGHNALQRTRTPGQNKIQTHTAASVKGWLPVSQLGGTCVYLRRGCCERQRHFLCLPHTWQAVSSEGPSSTTRQPPGLPTHLHFQSTRFTNSYWLSLQEITLDNETNRQHKKGKFSVVNFYFTHLSENPTFAK